MDTWNLVNENHLRSRKNGSASGSKFRKGDATAFEESIIHNMLRPNPFFLKTFNNFNASLLFGLYDIINNLICSPELITGSTLRFKGGLHYCVFLYRFTSFDDQVSEGILPLIVQGKLSCTSLCLLLVPKIIFFTSTCQVIKNPEKLQRTRRKLLFSYTVFCLQHNFSFSQYCMVSVSVYSLNSLFEM